ncbi:MAG TPA: PAS domain-containing protein [Pyrinomonadaceae bacterium]|jgi:PAS domain S-box-containing protein
MEDDLSRVLNALPGLVWTALPDGQIDFLNQRWCEYTGLSVDEACGFGWHNAIHPDDLPQLLVGLQSILASGESGEMEARLRRSDGDYRRFHVSASPLRDAAGSVVKWYGVSTDIEDLRRAEEALRVRELSFRLIVDSIPAPVAVTTPTGEVEALNQPTLEFFGKTYEELKGWKSSDVVHPDDLQRTVAAQVEAHETGRAYNVESRHRRADGVYRWFNVLGLPLRDTEGRILRWFILQIDIDDRKRAEEALLFAKRNLNQIINTIPALAWSAGKDGSAEFFNQQYLDFVGLSTEEASGWGWTAALHPDDRDGLAATWAGIMTSEEPGEAEARMRGHDGEYRWFLFRASPIRNEKGNIVKWYGINTDIDDLKKAEAAQQSSERNLSLTINTIPTLIQVSRPDGSILSVNQAVLDYYGVTLQDMQKEDFRPRSYHPDDVQRLHEWRKEALKRPLQFEYEQRARGKDGKYRWFLVRYNPLLDERGRIERWYATAFDIEDRKRAEEALRSAERNLNQIINTIPTHIYVLNTEGSVQYVNQAVMDYTGLSLEDVKQEDYRDRIIHPEDFKRVRAGRAASLRRGAPFSTEQRVLGNDGQYRWFLVRYKPLLDEQGRIVRWYVAAFDIEDRKRAEALLAGEKRLLEMVAGGNTLTSILDALCQLVEETASGYICGILLLDSSGTSVELARAPSLPPSYNEAILGWPVNPDSGPCARAVSLKEQVIVTDVASDLQWDGYGWRPLALSYGLRACWSSPILSSENAVLGTFALYSREPGGPTPQLQNVIGQMTHLAAVAIERQRAVEQLEAEQELLDLAQKSARAMAFDWHIQQEVNVWSHEQEALYGLPPGSFDGTYQSWKKLVYAPDWPLLLKAIEHAQETGEVAVEFRVVWPDGSFHWLATNGQMFFDDRGKPFRMVGFTSDVTPRKLAEEDLRRSEAFLAEAQHLSSIGSFSWRLATDEITWSEQLYRIYELEVGPPVTLELIRTRVHPEDLTLYEKMVGQARNGSDDFEWQYRLMMPDRTIKYLHAVAHATRDQDGELEYIAAVQDVTERRLSEEALGRLRSELAHVARVATLGALTASIAHEVNQPLSGIITNASTCLRMLNTEPPNVDGARETTRRTIRDGNRASEVITRLRALFSKKDATTESVDLNEATREVIALSLSELQGSRIILRTELSDDLPPVTGDRVQLQQVILNLVRNASDAMSAVGDRPRDLLIRTERDDNADRVRLSVQDAGVGFEPQASDRMFQAFYTTKDDGMGIGLSVSRSIIESHHGQLWATSNDGLGATFSFSIPCGPLV